MSSQSNQVHSRTQINFEPREFVPAEECEGVKPTRTFITDMLGQLTEVYCVGGWGHQWSQINSKKYSLKADTHYTIKFWLNGGENDRGSESCVMQIFPESNYGESYHDNYMDNYMVYRLNRSYIRPEKYNNGWYLYNIPFKTNRVPDKDTVDTIIQFGGNHAPFAVMPHAPAFDQLEDQPRPDPRIPQRHNIVFNDGYPRDSSWSHLVFDGHITYEAPESYASRISTPIEDRLLSMGVDIQEMLNDVDPADKIDLLRDILGV